MVLKFFSVICATCLCMNLSAEASQAMYSTAEKLNFGSRPISSLEGENGSFPKAVFLLKSVEDSKYHLQVIATAMESLNAFLLASSEIRQKLSKAMIPIIIGSLPSKVSQTRNFHCTPH